ncbi:MAG: hypothetical protein JWO43_669 [Candidatus Adlerbacteria bacterium]|nr:hypothetical protein [Candidatus Adlerbacteria bacterium]
MIVDDKVLNHLATFERLRISPQSSITTKFYRDFLVTNVEQCRPDTQARVYCALALYHEAKHESRVARDFANKARVKANRPGAVVIHSVIEKLVSFQK